MTSEYIEPSDRALAALFARASCLLLDFDGPLCRLFAPGHAPAIAQEMLDLLVDEGVLLEDEGLEGNDDPHLIVRAKLEGALPAQLEALLAGKENLAAESAEPTSGAEDFVKAVVERGRTLAITTNTAPRSVETYLKARGLHDAFGGRIFGRSTENPRRMKPDPDCLHRAMDHLRAKPADCLMIGDSPADALAAQAARVPFLGYAVSAPRALLLAQSVGAVPVVVGMDRLIPVVEALDPPKG